MINVRNRLGEIIFASVAGPDGQAEADRIHGSPGARWFTPDDPIQRVHSDASMFVGGMYALLLQTLHPTAMRAVAENSRYRDDMWGRLHNTSRFLAVTTFGTIEDAEQAIRIVNAIHRRVIGVMPDGTAYTAADPHLLEWIHVSQIHTFLQAYQTYGARPLNQTERDTYVAQVGEIGRRLGVIDLPQTEAENDAAMARFRPELRGTPEARRAARDIVFRPPMPVLARPPYLMLAGAAIALMPAWTRWPLRLPLLPLSERTVIPLLATAATGTIRWAMAEPGSTVAKPGNNS